MIQFMLSIGLPKYFPSLRKLYVLKSFNLFLHKKKYSLSPGGGGGGGEVNKTSDLITRVSQILRV